MIVALRTDSPVTELYVLDKKGTEVARDIWRSDRQLSVQLHQHLEDMLAQVSASYESVTGIIVFSGPGSFTGLRIGVTVANTLAYGLEIPIVGAQGDDWLETGLDQLANQSPGVWVMPHYGGEANITRPKK